MWRNLGEAQRVASGRRRDHDKSARVRLRAIADHDEIDREWRGVDRKQVWINGIGNGSVEGGSAGRDGDPQGGCSNTNVDVLTQSDNRV